MFEKTLCGLLAVLLAAATAAAEEAVVHVYNWSDYIDESILGEFEQETGIKVVYDIKFHSSEYINALANGDICLAMGWSGDVLRARDRAEEAGDGIRIRYVIPRQGALMWFDQMAIPADAPHPDNAHVFLNYILRPEVAAKATNYVYFASGNQAAQAHIDADILNDPAVYPTPDVMERLFTKGPYSPKVQRVVTRLWTRVKTGQ